MRFFSISTLWLAVSAGFACAQPAIPQSLSIETGRAKNGAITLAGRDAVQQLVVTGKYASGQLCDLTRDVKFAANPVGIVQVDSAGLIAPLKEGQAAVVVSSGSVSASI